MAVAFGTWVYLPWNSRKIWYFGYQTYEDPCNQYFWKNVLYFNNVPKFDSGCFGHSWYLAADMQMYAMSPIILIAFAMSPVAGILISIFLFMLSTAGNIITVAINHYPPSLPILYVDKDAINLDSYYQLIYYAMWIRCQVYIMGLCLGWFMQKYKKIKIPVFVQFAGWVLSLAFMLTVLFGLYNYSRGRVHMPLFWRAMYSAFSKPAWGLGLGWIIFVCYYGYGGPVNRFLSWNIWVPLGRLSYAAYLLHYTIVMDFVYSENDYAVIFNGVWPTFWYYVIPIVFLTFFFSLIWSSLFEVSIGKVETILLRPPRTKIHLEKKINDDAKMNNWDVDFSENQKKQNGTITFQEKL
uniref:Acyltransferase 3 domain-containing protein n=1 Tax=Panagrolaimus sp. JU765 TaxID=591449 RepID=A0AC34Q6M4_9BILA